MNTVSFPFTAWEPDKPDFNGGQVLRARGVIPAAIGYRPFPGPVTSGEALPGACRGACLFPDGEGLPMSVAGTHSRLFARSAGDWQERGTGYAENAGWNFALYGATLVAANGTDPLQYATVGVGSLSDFAPVADAPVAETVGVVGNFLMAGNLNGQAGAVRWSGIDDPLSWPTPGSNEAQYAQSDIQVFPEGGAVQAICSGMAATDGLIFCESAIYRAQYVGPPYVFQFSPVDKALGTIAPRSVVQAGNRVYFLADDGFYATDGANVLNIGAERINLWFRQAAQDVRRNEVQGAYDPVNGVIAWLFASQNCPAAYMDRLLLYRPSVDRFSLVAQNLEWLLADASRPATLESLDAYGSLDQLPFSLDSRAFRGGVRALGGFDTAHRPTLFAGDPVEASIETAEKGGERIMVHGARALIDGAPNTVSLLYRDFLKDAPQLRDCAPPSRRDGICRVRVSTRYARARVTIPGGTFWNHATGVDMYLETEGWK